MNTSEDFLIGDRVRFIPPEAPHIAFEPPVPTMMGVVIALTDYPQHEGGRAIIKWDEPNEDGPIDELYCNDLILI